MRRKQEANLSVEIQQQLSEARSAFDVALQPDSYDSDAIARGFTELESLISRASGAGHLTAEVGFKDLAERSKQAIAASEIANDISVQGFFVAKAQTYDLLLESVTQKPVKAPKQTKTQDKNMTGAKERVI